MNTTHDAMTVKRRATNMFHAHKRWAKEDRQAIDYSFLNLLDLVRPALDDGRCPYCGEALTAHNFSLDHDRPRSRGGRHTLPNLVVCCLRCNEVKGQLTGEEFRALIRLLRAWEPTGASSVLSRLRRGASWMRRH